MLFFAGPGGFEPPRAVLETAMLPLTSRPYDLLIIASLTVFLTSRR